MTRGGTPQVTFRMGKLRGEFAQRMDRHADGLTAGRVAVRDLGRYYEMIHHGRAELREHVRNGHDLNSMEGLSIAARFALLDAADIMMQNGASLEAIICTPALATERRTG
jgi:hypothetical protein